MTDDSFQATGRSEQPCRLSDTDQSQTASESRPDWVSETAAVLIAHGSRAPTANQQFVELTRRVRERTGWLRVEHAFLELVEPPVAEAVERCVVAGARRVLLLPYFLFGGLHGLEDIHKLRDQLQERHANVQFLVCQPLGVDDRLVELVRQRLEEAGPAD